MGVRLTAAGTRAIEWRAVGASVAGTRHHEGGVGCQDASLWSITEDGLVIAVADGAGSASRAGEGAVTAVRAAVASLAVAPSVESAFAVARRALEDAVDEACDCAPTSLADFATTLTVVRVTPERIEGARIGDGCVVVQRPDCISVALAPERSEYLNETRFVTSGDWWGGVETFAIADGEATRVSGVAVLTDGLQLLALDMLTGEPHAPFFGPLYDFAATSDNSDELASFLGSERVNARTDDDKTIVVAVRG